MDANKNGRQVPNVQCCICAESTEDVTSEEHGAHVDFMGNRLAALGRASWTAPAPPPAETAAAFKASGWKPREREKVVQVRCNSGLREWAASYYDGPVVVDESMPDDYVDVELPHLDAAGRICTGLMPR